MTYTQEEQQLIEETAKEYFKGINPKIVGNQGISILYRPNQLDVLNAIPFAFQSSAMQLIIESRIKAAKIELLDSALNWSNEVNDTSEYLQNKLNELKK